MQFGVFTIGDVTQDPTTGTTPTEHQRIKDTVRIAQHAEQAGFEVISAPMGYLSAGYERPLGGWLPESRVIWQSSLLLNEAIGLLAYPIVYGKQ